jgi:hypothetical protein
MALASVRQRSSPVPAASWSSGTIAPAVHVPFEQVSDFRLDHGRIGRHARHRRGHAGEQAGRSPRGGRRLVQGGRPQVTKQ